MSVMVPKGLAAAVLASIPAQEGMAGGEFIRDVTYIVILSSIVATSVMIPLLEKTRLSNVYENIFTGKLRKLPRAIAPRSLVSAKSDSRIKILPPDKEITPTGDKFFGDSKKE
ncbi:hypothetical protein ES703_64744 [subsurface metagenome]